MPYVGTNGHGANSHKWSKLVGGPCTFCTTIGVDKCNGKVDEQRKGGNDCRE